MRLESLRIVVGSCAVYAIVAACSAGGAHPGNKGAGTMARAGTSSGSSGGSDTDATGGIATDGAGGTSGGHPGSGGAAVAGQYAGGSDQGGLGGITFGLYLGCAAFLVGDVLLHRLAGEAESEPGPIDDPAQRGGGLSIALGAVLDGVPECAVLGLTILEGGSVGVAMLVAVLVSNLPEGVAATSSLRNGGWAVGRIVALWSGIALASAISAALGYGLLDGASSDLLAFMFAFAGGAILTMLATSMIPEAYEHARRVAGPVTVLGFAVAFTITWLE